MYEKLKSSSGKDYEPLDFLYFYFRTCINLLLNFTYIFPDIDLDKNLLKSRFILPKGQFLANEVK